MLVALNLMRGDFVADNQRVIHQVYDRAGRPLAPEAPGAVDKWSKEMGLSKSAIDSAFAAYNARFGSQLRSKEVAKQRTS
jgi:hypothetical protein